jgi:hypothetical protein
MSRLHFDRLNRACLAATTAIIALLPMAAAAQVATTLTLEAPRVILHSDALILHAKVTIPGGCPAASTPTGGQVTIHGGGLADHSYQLTTAVQRSCSTGSYSDAIDFYLGGGTSGDFTFTAEYSGANGYAPAVSAPITVTVAPYLSGPVANGMAKLAIVERDQHFYCAAHEASFDSSSPADAPPMLTLPFGQVHYTFSGCSFECEFLCWAGAPRFPLQVITVEMPQPLPRDASVWVHAAGAGMTVPVWRQVPATIDGTTVTFTITGNDGDRSMAGTIAIATDSAAARTDLQDLWWGGAAQNGWGFDISQQGDRIFAGLFAYRGDGSPTWLVMPGGTWDSTHTVFSGALYGATGSSFRQYDATRLNVQPTGTAKLTFAGTGAATIDYTIGTESGRKSIVRQPIGSTAQPVQGPHAGLWWGGIAQNGWGITIAHQDNRLFAVWYTYDASGNPTWYVMSGGSWLDESDYSGTLYRATGSSFLGGTYDPSKLSVTPVGRIGFTFYGPDVAYMGYEVDGQAGSATLYRQPF